MTQETLSNTPTISKVAQDLGVILPQDGGIDLWNEKPMIFSPPGGGKSTLMSDEHILRLDFDRKGGTIGGKGPVWPPKNQHLSWSDLCTQLPKVLKALPQVRMVAIDTFITALELAQTHVASQMGGQPFYKLDARRAWPGIYQTFNEFQTLIEDCGVNPAWLIHLVDSRRTVVKDGQEVTYTEEVVGLSEGIWKQLGIRPTIRFWLNTQSVELTEPMLDLKTGQPITRGGKTVTKGTGEYVKKTSAVFRCHPDTHREMSRYLNANDSIPAVVEDIPLVNGFSYLRNQVLEHSTTLLEEKEISE